MKYETKVFAAGLLMSVAGLLFDRRPRPETTDDTPDDPPDDIPTVSFDATEVEPYAPEAPSFDASEVEPYEPASPFHFNPPVSGESPTGTPWEVRVHASKWTLFTRYPIPGGWGESNKGQHELKADAIAAAEELP